MMNKQKITEIAKKILKSQKGLRSPQIMHPMREWLIGLLVAVVIFGLSTTWSIFMYLEYRDISINSDDVVSENIVYRGSLVNSALQEFSKREETYNNLLNVVTLPKVDETNFATTSTESLLEIVTSSSTDEIQTDAEEHVMSPEDIVIESRPILN